MTPILLQVSGAEILRDDAVRVAESARAVGVSVDLEIWDDMVHAWPLFARFLPEGQAAIESIGRFVTRHTGG
jgi:monoterpene epsilon-lactone hydrolase